MRSLVPLGRGVFLPHGVYEWKVLEQICQDNTTDIFRVQARVPAKKISVRAHKLSNGMFQSLYVLHSHGVRRCMWWQPTVSTEFMMLGKKTEWVKETMKNQFF